MGLEQELAAFFATRPEVVVAYLFGSRAAGIARRDSDTDIAVLPDESVRERFEYRLDLGEELERLVGAPVDVVILPEASLLLQFQVFRRGQIIFERDADLRSAYQASVMGKFYDYCRFFDFHAAALRKAILEKGTGPWIGG